MRVLSIEHAAEIQLAWLYRQQTELVTRHARVLLMAGVGAKPLASEYVAEIARRDLNQIKEQAA